MCVVVSEKGDGRVVVTVRVPAIAVSSARDKSRLLSIRTQHNTILIMCDNNNGNFYLKKDTLQQTTNLAASVKLSKE